MEMIIPGIVATMFRRSRNQSLSWRPVVLPCNWSLVHPLGLDLWGSWWGHSFFFYDVWLEENTCCLKHSIMLGYPFIFFWWGWATFACMYWHFPGVGFFNFKSIKDETVRKPRQHNRQSFLGSWGPLPVVHSKSVALQLSEIFSVFILYIMFKVSLKGWNRKMCVYPIFLKIQLI